MFLFSVLVIVSASVFCLLNIRAAVVLWFSKICAFVVVIVVVLAVQPRLQHAAFPGCGLPVAVCARLCHCGSVGFHLDVMLAACSGCGLPATLCFSAWCCVVLFSHSGLCAQLFGLQYACDCL